MPASSHSSCLLKRETEHLWLRQLMHGIGMCASRNVMRERFIQERALARNFIFIEERVLVRILYFFIEEGNRALVNKATQHKPTFSLLDLRWLLPSQRKEEEMIGVLASRSVAVACNRMVRNSHIMMDHPAGTLGS